MKTNSIISSFILVLLLLGQTTKAQHRVLIHSHNDYKQCVPFYQAYAQQIYSIEVDIFIEPSTQKLLVAHEKSELGEAQTIEELYLTPLINAYKQNGGKAWKKSNANIQLTIDIKTEAKSSLELLVAKLNKNPEVFDKTVNPNAVRIVISGNRPTPSEFINYPSYIMFDGEINTNYTAEQLSRVEMFSEPFSKYSKWNGKGNIIDNELILLKTAIEKSHKLNKNIRFWGTPDSRTAWNTFHTLGIDYINTDLPEACADHFRNFENKNFRIKSDSLVATNKTISTDRLDKTTASFKGFDDKSQTLSKRIEVYRPTNRYDEKVNTAKNIILLIGDGMGLSQVFAAETVNRSLSMLQLKYMGLQRTQPKGSFITDSAGAGSAIATGKKNKNRHISMNEIGEIYPSIPEIIAPKGVACGVVTLGNVADATPAAFYAHSLERDNSDEITNWLQKGNLSVLCGSGNHVFTNRKDKQNLVSDLKLKYNYCSTIDSMNLQNGKVICIDERMAKACDESTLPLLKDATNAAIKKLSSISKKGFFLMIEGAKIDYAGHANSLPNSIMETLSFDLAVAEALKFADSNGETLVIVTADHETGGLVLIDGDKEKGMITGRYTTDDHTPIMIPVFAYGPNAKAFQGVYENTEIFDKIIKTIQK